MAQFRRLRGFGLVTAAHNWSLSSRSFDKQLGQTSPFVSFWSFHWIELIFNVNQLDLEKLFDADDLPYAVMKLGNVPITIIDETTLYAHMWTLHRMLLMAKLRLTNYCNTLRSKKNNFNTIRDSIRNPYYSVCGFALIRVDLRGCRDSDEVLEGAYLKQEHEENLKLFDCIESQPGSNGHIGQFGTCRGGFNGLQVAVRQHRALKAIITLCSTG